MAFDGIVIASLVHEFNQTIAGGKIAKNCPAGKRTSFYLP